MSTVRRSTPSTRQPASASRLIRLAFSVLLTMLTYVAFSAAPASAGPPFVTDDPEPVEYRHWEIYLAALYAHDKDGTSGNLPQFEANFGPLKNIQIAVTLPLAYAGAGSGFRAGFGDAELGVKYRFLQESPSRPQVAFYPLVDFPTGNASTGLGAGNTRLLLPLWLQKSSGHWTVYGGGGYWLNSGASKDKRNSWFSGVTVLNEVSKGLQIGGELFHQTPQAAGEPGTVGFNLGLIAPMGETHNILFSAGRALRGSNSLSAYGAYELYLVPKESAAPK